MFVKFYLFTEAKPEKICFCKATSIWLYKENKTIRMLPERLVYGKKSIWNFLNQLLKIYKSLMNKGKCFKNLQIKNFIEYYLQNVPTQKTINKSIMAWFPAKKLLQIYKISDINFSWTWNGKKIIKENVSFKRKTKIKLIINN